MPRYSNRCLSKTIRYLNRCGLSDGAIAGELYTRRGLLISKNRVRLFRIKFGLPCNYYNAAHRKKVSDLRKAEAKENGITLGSRINIGHRMESLRQGWDIPLSLMERKICECLLDGPKTLEEIKLLLNRKTRPGVMLTRMYRDGLVIRKRVTRYVWEYSLGIVRSEPGVDS